jgi:hypothetical protein
MEDGIYSQPGHSDCGKVGAGCRLHRICGQGRIIQPSRFTPFQPAQHRHDEQRYRCHADA